MCGMPPSRVCNDSFAVSSGYSLNLWAHLLCIYVCFSICVAVPCVYLYLHFNECLFVCVCVNSEKNLCRGDFPHSSQLCVCI